jgi:hypothetical protein
VSIPPASPGAVSSNNPNPGELPRQPHRHLSRRPGWYGAWVLTSGR